VACLAFLSLRFSFNDFPDFFDWCWRGDLSAISCSLRLVNGLRTEICSPDQIVKEPSAFALGSEGDQLELVGADRSERVDASAASPDRHRANVLGFLALAAGAYLKLDGLALSQGRPDGLEVRNVNEHVLAATISRDETEPAVVIEELHFALHN
jgi:hypothetical protein